MRNINNNHNSQNYPRYKRTGTAPNIDEYGVHRTDTHHYENIGNKF